MEKINGRFQFYFDKSTIDDLGLFANELIPAGEELFFAFGKVGEHLPESKKFENHYVQLYPNNFCNHSENPNTQNFWVNDLYIVKKSLRVILPGEEITSNYKVGMQLIKSKGFRVDNWLWFD